jgi:hypothetical protein
LLPLQTKLEVGAVDDPLEHEAERVATQVMRMPPSGASPPRCACGGTPGPDGECPSCRAKRLARMAIAPAAPTLREAPPSVDAAVASRGTPLDTPTREFFEPRLGVDLGAVRVHDDGSAQASARDVAARAYTVGSDIVLGAGYRPGSEAGRALLAHELAHVVQQRAARPRVQRQPAPGAATVTTAPAKGGVTIRIKAATRISGSDVYVLTVMAGRHVLWDQAVKLIEKGVEVGCVHPVCQSGLQAGEALEVFFGPPQGASSAPQPQQAQAKVPPLPVEVQNALDSYNLQAFIESGRRGKQLELSSQGPSSVDYAAVVSVRNALLRLTSDDLDCYRRWLGKRVPRGWAEIAKSLAEFRGVRADVCEPVDLGQLKPLTGTENLYALIKEYEELDKQPKTVGRGEPNEPVLRKLAAVRAARDKALNDAGFADIDAFDTAADTFRVYFRGVAIQMMQHLLLETQQVLYDAVARYQVGDKPDIQLRYQVTKAARDLYQELLFGHRSFEQLAEVHPILHGRGARDVIGRASSDYEMSWRLTLYALERLRDLRFVQGSLRRAPDAVFKFDVVVAATMTRLNVQADSIHAAVIADQRGKPGESWIDKLIDTGLLLLSFVPGPIGIVAGAASAIRDVAAAGMEYGELERAYDIGALSERPSTTPILIAAGGAVAAPVAVAGLSKTLGFAKRIFTGARAVESTVAKTAAETELKTVAKAELPKVHVPEAELPKVHVPEAEVPKVHAPEAEVPKVHAPEPEPPKVHAPEPEPPKPPKPEVEGPVYDPGIRAARESVHRAEDEAAAAAARATRAVDNVAAATEAERLANDALARARREASVAVKLRDEAKALADAAEKGEVRTARAEFTAAKNAAKTAEERVARLETRAQRAAEVRQAAAETAEWRKGLLQERAETMTRAETRAARVEKAVAEGEVPRLQPGEEFTIEKWRPNLGRTGPKARVTRGVAGELEKGAEVRIFKDPFISEAHRAELNEILELAKTNPQEAGNRFAKLTGKSEGWTEIAEVTTVRHGRIGRRWDFGRTKEITIEGRAGKMGGDKLDQLWFDLNERGVIDLTVPKLHPDAADQLARLAGEWAQLTGRKPLVLVRETLP